jgi:hypothetical protein
MPRVRVMSRVYSVLVECDECESKHLETQKCHDAISDDEVESDLVTAGWVTQHGNFDLDLCPACAYEKGLTR